MIVLSDIALSCWADLHWSAAYRYTYRVYALLEGGAVAPPPPPPPAQSVVTVADLSATCDPDPSPGEISLQLYIQLSVLLFQALQRGCYKYATTCWSRTIYRGTPIAMPVTKFILVEIFTMHYSCRDIHHALFL